MALLAAGLSGCFGHPAHPVTSTPSPPAQGAIAGAPARGGDMARALLFVRQHAVWKGEHPGLVFLPHVERDVVNHFRGRTPLGPLRTVAAFGIHGPSPLTPEAMADLLLDDEAERLALAASTFRTIPEPTPPSAADRTAFRVEFLDRGAGPFTFDFRFTIGVERRDVGDGSLLLRYLALPTGDAEGVTLYRGACLIEKDGEGSRVTEYLVVGTSFAVPFFLARAARAASLRMFQDRAQALWTRARWRKAGTDPLMKEE